MTDYVKSTNFTSKDSLATGNPLKIVKGAEFDVEFNNIATAVATKADSSAVSSDLALKAPLASPALTGTPTAPTAAVNTNTTQVATTAFTVAQIADDAPTKTGGGASGNWGINITGNAASATNATNATNAVNAATVNDDAITKDKLQSPAAGSAYLISRLVINEAATAAINFSLPDRLYSQGSSVGVTVLVPGVIRCYLEHRNVFGGGYTTQARISKNGVQQALWSTTSSSYTTRTLDLSVDVGDLIVFQQTGSPYEDSSAWRNVFIYSNNPSMAVA
jgi:hypothetical protein